MAAELPGVEEGTSYGTPALKVQGKLMARLWEDGVTLVLKVPFMVQEFLLRGQPKVFFLTDHYRGYPVVLVRLPLVDRGQFRALLEDAWRQVAGKRLQATYDAGPEKAPSRPGRRGPTRKS
jgi:hypothetical protein